MALSQIFSPASATLAALMQADLNRLFDINSDMTTGAVKLDFLPVPERSMRGNMSFNPSQGLGNAESKLKRAVKALPFLGITLMASYFMFGM